MFLSRFMFVNVFNFSDVCKFKKRYKMQILINFNGNTSKQ